MLTRKVWGACPHDCPDTCGLVTEVQDGQIVGFSGAAQNPITQGWLCAKVRNYPEHVYHPDRLTRPLRRAGAKGGGHWEPISWEEAVGEIGDRWREIIATYGAEAILPYSYSGTLGLVQLAVSNGRFWNRLGASQLERAICCEAASTAVTMTLGAKLSPEYADVVHSRLVIIWGHNPVSTAPHFMPFLRQAQRNGCQLIVIDPVRTRTARGADWHIAPRPGTDGALALGIAHAIVSADLHDEAWLQANTVGWPALRRRLKHYPPERVAAMTGVPADDIERLARMYARNRPSLIKTADGLNRHPNGGQTIRALLALPALTGQYGVLGGGFSYSSSGYAAWDDETINKWSDAPPPGRSVNMNRLGAALLGEVTDPPIKSLYVFAANPVAASPNAGKIVRGLQREDLFTVVHELFLTDTADYADIVLPATSQLEQVDLHRAYGHNMLTFNEQAIEPRGEAKSNWDVMRLLAAEMGFTEPWLQVDALTVIEEVLAATAESIPTPRGVTVDRLRRDGHIALPWSPRVPWADGVFATPSGKVELSCDRLVAHGLDPLPQYVPPRDNDGGGPGFDPAKALNLMTGASHHFVTTSLANHDRLRRAAGPPLLSIHPDDAAERGINSGDLVTVANARGRLTLRAKVTEDVRPGVVASPKGHWAKHNGGRNVNWLTPDALGDLAGQSTFHTNSVWVWREEPEA